MIISYLISIICVTKFKYHFFGLQLVKLVLLYIIKDIDIYKSDKINEENKLIMFGFGLLNLVITYTYEFIVDKLLK